ncbi:RNA 2',3'-cyclic phosphodiesterase [Tractidigestivibacter scatoligenes]|jgi:2'-5' RNA ligase|uniref:RNA 2',3'-cyclic phosphodiesterase n=1 Tax=Tractidigestivibacter scatoligenes TaxID=1299998 RepID=UPI002F35A01A
MNNAENHQLSADQTQKRLFIALRFSEEEQEALAQSRDAVLERLRSGHPTATANIHLTLAFLGMLDCAGEQRAASALRAAANASGPVALSLGSLGVFLHRRGGIVWRGASRQEGLLALQHTLVQELATRGLPVDEEPFVPHVTLVRGARPTRSSGEDGTPDLRLICDEVSRHLAALETRHTEVSLMWSHHPTGEQLTYTPILTAPLRGWKSCI